MGITDPESVAEHTCRAAVLGYVLTSLVEGADPMRTVAIYLFHDATLTVVEMCQTGQGMGKKLFFRERSDIFRERTSDPITVKLGDLRRETLTILARKNREVNGSE